MEKKKLTEEEILKAWYICQNTFCCTNECPYFNKNGRNFCVEGNAIYNDLKDLIKRKNAEIERLTNLAELRKRDNDDTCKLLFKEKDKNDELQKKVDELKELNKKYLDSIESVQAGRCRFRCELTNKAVKDTAEKFSKMLIEKADINREWLRSRVVFICDIENVLEEIKEGKNG